jgi:hypothetical protein
MNDRLMSQPKAAGGQTAEFFTEGGNSQLRLTEN